MNCKTFCKGMEQMKNAFIIIIYTHFPESELVIFLTTPTPAKSLTTPHHCLTGRFFVIQNYFCTNGPSARARRSSQGSHLGAPAAQCR